MNDGSIGSTFNEGMMKVEGETAYCIDINTDFKNGYKTRADASSRMSADQISDVALSLEYVKQYGEVHKELNYKQIYLLEQCVVWQRLSVHLGWQCDNVRASYNEIPKSTQDEVFAGAKAFVKEPILTFPKRIPMAGEWMTRSFPAPPISPGVPVFGRAVPLEMILPRLWPRMVSITRSTSSPAAKPGPRPIVLSAIFRFVPRFFFARIASTRAQGRTSFNISHVSSIIMGMAPASKTAFASAKSDTFKQVTPSISLCPS